MLHGDIPGRTKQSEIVIAYLDVAGAAPGRLIRREVEGVGDSVTLRKRRTGLEERSRSRWRRGLVTLADDDDRWAGWVRATDDAVGKEDSSVRNPLPFNKKLGRPLEPRTDLEEGTRGLPGARGRIELRVDFARRALRIGGVTKAREEDGVAHDEGG